MATTQTGRRKAGGAATDTVSAPVVAAVAEPGKPRLPGVLINPYLPQPGQHVGRRIIKIDDTPADYWLDVATAAGVQWSDKLGLERSDVGIWDVRKPELLTSSWFSARARTRPRTLGTPLRRVAVAVNAEALEVQAATGSLRSWAQGRRSGQTARQSTKDGDPLPGPDPFNEHGGSGGSGSGGAGAAEESDAAVTFQHSLIQLEDGVLGWPTTTWGGTPTETPIDVEAPPEPAFFIIQVIGIQLVPRRLRARSHRQDHDFVAGRGDDDEPAHLAGVVGDRCPGLVNHQLLRRQLERAVRRDGDGGDHRHRDPREKRELARRG